MLVYLIFWNSAHVFLLVLFLKMEGTCHWNYLCSVPKLLLECN